MRTHSAFLLFGLLLLSTSARTGAQLAVAVAVDLERDVRWIKEDVYWNEVIQNSGVAAKNSQILVQNTQQVVRNTNDLLVRLGKTASAVKAASVSLPRSTDAVATAVRLDTRRQTLATATQRYSLNQVPLADKNDPGDAVSASYAVFGGSQHRDAKRYASFAARQAMNDRSQLSAENAEKVETEELSVQARALDGLKAATTQADVDVYVAALEASTGRLDLAHAKMNQAKMEEEAYQGRLAIEKERKAEADREWTQAVVSGLRARALEAYKRQNGSAAEDPGT